MHAEPIAASLVATALVASGCCNRCANRATTPSNYRWVVLLFAWGALLLTFVDRIAWSNLAIPVGNSLAMAVGALGVFVTAFYSGYVLSNFGWGRG